MEQWYDYAGDPAAEARWAVWNTYSELPMPGESLPFDTFLKEKGLTREALVRIGCRSVVRAGDRNFTLSFLFPDGLKYRSLDGKRWTEPNVTWTAAKKVAAQPGETARYAIVAEGETDAAALADRLRSGTSLPGEGTGAPPTPDVREAFGEASAGEADSGGFAGEEAASCDLLLLPAGGKFIPPNLKAQLANYERVYVALDNDEVGNEGAAKILELLPSARRVLPPVGAKDWCEALAKDPTLLDTGGIASFEVRPPRRVFSVREVLAADLGSYAENNWFDHDILPIGGEMACHGPIKSLKSFVVLDLARAITTGTAFAQYYEFCRPAGPGRVLMIQFEIPPRGFQSRLASTVASIPTAQQDLFYDNFMIYGIADRSRPRLKMQDQSFVSTIRRAVEEAEADVVMFDPMQRMTGGANADKAHEMEPILDVFSQLQNAGLTVVYTHHDTKSGGNNHAAYNMSGSQRFGADADSICSLIYDPSIMIPDDNAAGIKQRNFVWTLRSGSTIGRSITVSQDARDPEWASVTFDSPIEAAPVTSTTSSASATGAALGMPSIT